MKKFNPFYLIIFFIIFDNFSCNAQDSLLLEKYLPEIYYEYPVKINITEDFIYRNDQVSTYNQIMELLFNPDSKIGFNSNIAPALQDLKDGKYVMYYDDFEYKKNGNSIFLTKQVACIFEIKNNQLNGMSYWFSPIDQRLYKKGLYKDKNREGEWILFYEFIYIEDVLPNSTRKKSKKNVNPEIKVNINHSCSYQQGFKHGPELKWNTYVSEKIQFIQGKKEGRYEFKNGDSIQIEGTYKNNEKIGEWNYFKPIYLKNDMGIKEMKLIERFYINDQKTPISEKVEWGNFDCYNGGPYGIVDGVFITSYNLSITPIENSDENFIDNFEDHIVKSDGENAYFKYLKYEKYYDNGQLYLKYKVENGNLEKKNTDIYYDDGKLKCQLDYLSDSIYCIKKTYNKCNEICDSVFIDSLGQVDYRYIEIGDKIYRIFDNIYNYSISVGMFSKYSKDTLTSILSQSLDPKSKDVIFEKTYEPATYTGKYFKSEFSKNLITKGKFQLDSNLLTTNYKQTTTIGPFTFYFQTIDSLNKNWAYKYYKKQIKDSILELDLLYLGFTIDTMGKSICKENEDFFNGKIKFIFSDSIDFKFEKKHSNYIFHIRSNYQNLDVVKSLFPSIKNQLPYSLILNFLSDNCSNTIKLKSIELPFKNGKINGKIICDSDKNEKVKEVEIVDNLVNGKAKSYWYYNNQKRYLGRIEEYVNNQLNGWYIQYNEKGKITSKTFYPIPKFNLTGTKKWKDIYYSNYEHTQEFVNGIKNGKYERYDNNRKIKWVANYSNDTLNGIFNVYDNNRLVQKGTISKGFLIDTLYFYDTLGQIKNLFIYNENRFIKQINYVNTLKNYQLINIDSVKSLGFPSDKYYSSFLYRNSIGRYKVTKDGVYRYYDDYDFENLNGYFEKYDINGNINYQGKYQNGNKISNWNYFDTLNGKYSINYFDSIIKVNDTLSFKTKGLFVQKNWKNENIFKKYLLDQNSLYICSLNENFDINTFFTFFEKDTALHGLNGYQKQYYLNGVLQCEGENQNGLPTGLWKFYNDNGSLREIGYFKNGKKQGRWLAGDLSRIHYTGDICLDFDNPKMKSYIEKLNEKLEVWVYYFLNGEQLSAEYFEFKK
ncbi:MAG: hypothetical protein HYR91_04655 [Flavobacteriia bacterium]|nr:hypothetical protein [Flavobacteriia bacterium]